MGFPDRWLSLQVQTAGVSGSLILPQNSFAQWNTPPGECSRKDVQKNPAGNRMSV